MATKDISRFSFDPEKHYSSVRMQQGRVMIDDDWNENERIENEDRRRARVEVIGSSGSPDRGFHIDNTEITSTGHIDFKIESGSLFLGGLRLEIDKNENYRLQKDWLQQSGELHPAPEEERYDLVYLEAWQQPVCAIEDSELFEVALGGADTSMRIRNMNRVRIEPGVKTSDCKDAWQRLIEKWEVNGKGILNRENERVPDANLQVDFIDDGNPDSLCTPLAAGGYLGAENQAIRVQIVDKNHLTWGFDNAAPLYRVSISENGETVTLKTDPKDQAHWPLAGQTVEILPWSAVLPNGEKIAEVEGHLSKVESSYDPDIGEFTLSTPLLANFGKEWTSRSDKNDLMESSYNFYMRIWNRGSDQISFEKIPFTAGTPLLLGNTGLEITISGDDHVSGNYWIIAARPETPNQVVPWKLEEGLAPIGIRRFYTPLALIHWNVENDKVTGEVIHDCRNTFRPLTDLKTCCSYTVGDNIHSFGDYNSLEEALKNVSVNGGKICLLPGTHTANLVIDKKNNIQISGCGERTIVNPSIDRAQEPIFLIRNSQRIILENMTLVSATGSAIHVSDNEKNGDPSTNIHISDNHIIACIQAIFVKVNNEIAGNNDIRIMNNEIGMLNREEGLPAIYSQADDVLIERNRIVVIPAPDPDDPSDLRNPDDPDKFYGPCDDLFRIYTNRPRLLRFIHGIFIYMSSVSFTRQNSYLAQGGIQIGGGSEGVKIIRNRIIGGNGNGITLGHVPVQKPDGTIEISSRRIMSFLETTPEEFKFLNNHLIPFIYEVSIEDNLIIQMGLSGIGVPAFFKSEKVALICSVEDLTVYRNRIKHCAHQTPEKIDDEIQDEIGFGGIVLASCENAIIQENRIENNGKSQLEPVCGILILYAEKIDVSDNRIINNGPRTFAGDEDAKMGLRGGIVIGMSFKQIVFKQLKADTLLSPDGIPAVRIHNNIVMQPLGQALIIIALGPVSVIGNQLTSQGASMRVNPLSVIAGAVFILNLGISKDLIAKIFLSKFKDLYAASKTDITYSSGLITTRAVTADISNSIQKILYFPNGNVLFTNNQTTLDLRDKKINFAFSSQLIASLDDVAYNSNQSECTSFIDMIFTDVALIAVSIRANDNRFQEGFTVTLNSLFSLGFMNSASSNQATHCIQAHGTIVIKPIKDGDGNLVPIDGNLILYDGPCKNQFDMIEKALTTPKKTN